MRFGSNVSVWTKKAASVSPAKPQWLSAIRKWAAAAQANSRLRVTTPVVMADQPKKEIAKVSAANVPSIVNVADRAVSTIGIVDRKLLIRRRASNGSPFYFRANPLPGLLCELGRS